MVDIDSFYQDLDEQNKLRIASKVPKWVSKNNRSWLAYNCICKLKEVKLKFIKKSKLTKAFSQKKKFLITKVEVARAMDLMLSGYSNISSQTLFSKNDFSIKLTAFFDEQNKELSKMAEIKIKNAKTSLRSRSKSELVSVAQENRVSLTKIKQNTALELLELTINRLPLDVKRKLDII